MRISISLVLAGLALAAHGLTAGEKKSDTKIELKKLEGNWKMEKAELQGSNSPNADQMKIVIEERIFKFYFGGDKVSAAKLTINPSKSPKTVDFNWTAGSVAGKTSLGIYRFNKDGYLEICMNQAQGPGSDKRPTKFTTKPSVGKGSILYVLEKEKDEDK